MNGSFNKYFRNLLILFIAVILGWYAISKDERVTKKTEKFDQINKGSKNFTLIDQNKKSEKQNSAIISQKKSKNLQNQTIKKKSQKLIRSLSNKIISKEQAKEYRPKYFEYFEEGATSFDEDYIISSQLRAYPADDIGARVPLFQIGNFFVFEEEIEEPGRQHNKSRIVYNKSTKKYAVLTGLVFLRFIESRDKEEIEKEFDVNVVEVISDLNMVVVIPNEGTSLNEFLNKIKDHSDIEDFEVEILEGGLHEK